MLYSKAEEVPRRNMRAHAHMINAINKRYHDFSIFHKPISSDYTKKTECPSYKIENKFLFYKKRMHACIVPTGIEEFKKYKPLKRKLLLPVFPTQLVPVISEETLIKAKEMGIFRSDFDIKKVLEL